MKLLDFDGDDLEDGFTNNPLVQDAQDKEELIPQYRGAHYLRHGFNWLLRDRIEAHVREEG